MLARAGRSMLVLLGVLALGLPASCQAQQATTASGSSTTAPTLPPYLRQDLYPKWIDGKAQIKWPPHDGCAAAPVSETLAVGTLIDRFGSEGGVIEVVPGDSAGNASAASPCKGS
jgi:hypothetical protein